MLKVVASAVVLSVVFGASSALAAHHEGAGKQDPVVGGLMIEDADAFVDAITTGYRASRLLGAGVFNDTGEQVGSVNEVVVGSDLRVGVAIISVGGFLGVGSRLVAIPADRFERNASGDIVLPGATKKALSDLPEFKYLR